MSRDIYRRWRALQYRRLFCWLLGAVDPRPYLREA